MKEVKINGFTYYWDGKLLFEDEHRLNPIDIKFLTQNERSQLETWVKYNGVPMWSY